MTDGPGRAIACRRISDPRAPFGLRVDLTLLLHAIKRAESGTGTDRSLDADVYEALGWDVLRGPTIRRRMGWQFRSPLSLRWHDLPSPTADVQAASMLAPWRWSWQVGMDHGHPVARCYLARSQPGGGLSSEARRLTLARSMLAAALDAQRQALQMAGAFLQADPIAVGDRHA